MTAPLRSVDHIRYGTRYRLCEPERDYGASVRAAEQQTVCATCDRVIPQYRLHVLVPRVGNYHLDCAISTGLLEPV